MATNNPLHKYREYQYHFIIVATDDKGGSMHNIDSDNTNLDRWQHPLNPADRYKVKTINDTKYVVIYNSMTDSQYSITNLSIEQTFIDTTKPNPISVLKNLSMVITEPYTIDFTTALSQAAISLGLVVGKDNTNIQTLHLGLKILFVGYVDGFHKSSPRIFSSNNIIPFCLNSMDLNLSNKGAVYNIKCTPLMNSVANSEFCSNVGGGGMLLSEKLSDAVADFEEEINRRANVPDDGTHKTKKYQYQILLDPVYTEAKYQLDLVSDDQRVYPKGMKPTVNQATGNKDNTQDVVNIPPTTTPPTTISPSTTVAPTTTSAPTTVAPTTNPPLVYDLTPIQAKGNTYDSTTVVQFNESIATTTTTTTTAPKDAKNNTQSTNNKADTKNPTDNKTERVKTIQFSTDKGHTILDSLYHLLTLSHAVCEDIVKDDASTKTAKYYRPIIETSMVFNSEKNVNVFVYHVIRQVIPANEVGAPPPDDNTISMPLEYDYIYTGKNVDILKFDIAVNMNFTAIGMAPSEVIVPSSNKTAESQQAATNAATNKAVKNGDKMLAGSHHSTEYVRYNVNDKSSTPVPAGVADAHNAAIGSLNPMMMAAARKKLANAISLITKTKFELQIIGNPLLLNATTPPAGKYGFNGKIHSVKEVEAMNAAHEKKTGFTSKKIPTAKVNIRIPKPAYLQGYSTGDGDNYYSTPFWISEGGYFIKGMVSNFSGGQFTQTLSLVSMPNTGAVVADAGANNTPTPAPTPTTVAPTTTINPNADNTGMIPAVLNPNTPKAPILTDISGNESKIPPLNELAKK